MAQQALGRHNHKGFAKITLYLTSQQVEILGWSGGIANLDVFLGTQLKKTLQFGA